MSDRPSGPAPRSRAEPRSIPSGLVIRRARASDAGEVTRIYVESSNAAFAAYQPSRAVTGARTARWRTDLTAPGYQWWLAEMAGTTVGFAGVGPSRDLVESDVGELDTIAVSPGFWRRGIGVGLMVTANRRLDDGYAYAVLWTWTGYQAAYHFYPNVGWRLTSVTRDEGRQVMFRRP